MIRDKYNIIPTFMALMLHALFIASLLFVFKFPSSVIATPLALEATLVSADSLEIAASPVIREPEPEPIPEPEPEPEPVAEEPDEEEQARAEAEEQMRLQERAEAEEQMRLQEQAREEQRVRDEQEAERRKKEKEAEQRRQAEEAELERQRAEAEKKRLEDIERQRKENERLKEAALAKEAEDLRLREIADEEARLAAMNSGAMAKYQFALQQKIMRNWVAPASALPGIECVIDVRQLPGGHVVSATVGRCNGDDAVRRSIEAAVSKASPLPEPDDPNIFQRDLRITFKPEE